VRNRRLFLGSSLVVILMIVGAVNGFSQVQGTQSRIPQQVFINGVQVNGAFVIAANGGMQAYTCPAPQQYTTPDGSSQGWACFEQSTNTWLLNAVAPAQPQVQTQPPVQNQAQVPPPPPQQTAGAPLPQPPAVIYQQPAPAVVYANPYPAYPAYPTYPVFVAAAYPAPYFYGPAFIGPRFYVGFGPVFYGRFGRR